LIDSRAINLIFFKETSGLIWDRTLLNALDYVLTDRSTVWNFKNSG